MNVKKYLREQAKKDYQEILSADDGELLRSLQARVVEKPRKCRYPSHFKAWIAGVASIMVAVIVVVCTIAFFPTDSPEIYLEENHASYVSDLGSLNQDMHEFYLTVDDSLYDIHVNKTIDKISGDVLFYSANIVSFDTLVRADIVAVCNKHYKYNFHTPDEPVTAELEHYRIVYQTTISADPDFGVNMLNGIGAIQKESEYIFITSYNELMLDENGSFFDIIQSIIQVRQ